MIQHAATAGYRDFQACFNLRDLEMSNQKKHLFICGCPRSGTTALWQLMVAHPKIVLGVERYVLLSFKKGLIEPALFAKEKFFDLQPNETFYTNLVEFSAYYTEAARNFSEATWVGDKVPTLYLDYGGIEANFDNAHILYIARNIVDVAGSYQKRATNVDDHTWSPDRDYRRAVHDWRASLRTTLDFLGNEERHSNLKVIFYEDLFLQPADLAPIFDWLELPVIDSVTERYKRLLAQSRNLDTRRGDALNSLQRQHITLNAPFALYRQLLDKRLSLAPSPIP